MDRQRRTGRHKAWVIDGVIFQWERRVAPVAAELRVQEMACMAFESQAVQQIRRRVEEQLSEDSLRVQAKMRQIHAIPPLGVRSQAHIRKRRGLLAPTVFYFNVALRSCFPFHDFIFTPSGTLEFIST
eukprot:1706518-Pleurochrysis_carterae.AAC.1